MTLSPAQPGAPRRAFPASFSVARLLATYPKGTLQLPGSLRPCWDVILSILREAYTY